MPAVMPATPLAFSQELLSSLYAGEADVQQLQAQLSTGSSIITPSDNPAGAVDALSAQAAAAQAGTWVSNASDGTSRLGLANQVLSQVLGQISQLQQLAESTSTANFSPAGMASLATQVQSVGQSILANANTSYEGYAIFGGTSGATDAFSSSGAYLGNGTVPMRTAGPGTQLPAGVSGDSVFGSGATGLFGVINQMVSDLQAGNVNAVLGTDLPAINTWYENVQGSAAQVGAYYDQMEAAQQQATSTQQTLSTQASDLTAVNLPQAATEISLRNSTLQAALYSLAQVVPQSLVPYLP
jgi:flagellar hook-associated protein 3 FlgL